jgi:hypothetical protein
MNRLPNVSTPCKDCPMTKTCTKGWLGGERMKNILGQDSFVCHKNTKLQCAGHILMKGYDNTFYRMAKMVGLNLKLTGREKVFDTEAQCIEHHGGENT